MNTPAHPPLTRRSLPAVPIALGALAIGVLVFVLLLVHGWPPTVACADDTCKEAREWIAFSVTLFVLVGGLFQYWRGQQWKRAEFLAGEMRSFFSAPRVQKALTMIDWGGRPINLYDSTDATVKPWPLVTRAVQVHALLPHPVANELAGRPPSTDEIQASDDLESFPPDEAAIRDCFDELLNGLERFGSYVATGLMTSADLKPYLAYWIDDIASIDGDTSDLAWTCSFLAYVEFYRFTGVQSLFADFGYDVTTQGPRFATFLSSMSEPVAGLLAKQFGLNPPRPVGAAPAVAPAAAGA